MEYPKKLIEVALPLDDISKASAHEKTRRHGHPSSIHLWWARRPLAAARAILFAQLVNDPGGKRGYGKFKGQTLQDAQIEREKLFKIIRELVLWENSNNDDVLEVARNEIEKSWKETCELTDKKDTPLPPFLDLFAGGGAIPLEAQRLGLEANASDLNPVAVLINKAMIEAPPKFKGRKAVFPEKRGQQKSLISESDGQGGLAFDVEKYGNLLCEKAEQKLSDYYPLIKLPEEYGGNYSKVIAWLWVRTVASPNPVLNGKHVPLVRSFWLSKKKGKEAWVEPIVDKEKLEYHFEIMKGNGSPSIERTVHRRHAECILSGTTIPLKYIEEEGRENRLGHQLMAIVTENNTGRVYLEPTIEQEELAKSAKASNPPSAAIEHWVSCTNCVVYGFDRFEKLFTSRQLATLSTFSDLISDIHEQVEKDAVRAGFQNDSVSLENKGDGARAYADTISLYLAFVIDQIANQCSSFCGWNNINQQMKNLFSRQAIPMVWDFAESNPFSGRSGSFKSLHTRQVKGIQHIKNKGIGKAFQSDAASMNYWDKVIISTDPPYYDNIPYSNLSDFFYIWLRRSLRNIFPSLLSTMVVPRDQELVANRFRHGSRENAAKFFINGMTSTMSQMAQNAHPAFPVTIYYAFKQSETKKGGTLSTGWATFLESVIRAGFMITGTWPVRTEFATGIKASLNALASSIIIVCRKRKQELGTISRKQFLRELDNALPGALEEMIGGRIGISPIAPVDLAQASIGPGMAVFSKYEAVLEADGSPMSIETALILINKAIDEYFTEAESDMGPDTRFCVDWFLQYGFSEGQFGEADVLARAKGTTVEGIALAGVVKSGTGKVRLFKLDEYPDDWDPENDKRLPIWEACHQLCRALRVSETEAGFLLSKMMDKGEPVRQLAYRLYTQCERKGWAEDAGVYNQLITSWPAILDEARKGKSLGQQKLPGMEK